MEDHHISGYLYHYTTFETLTKIVNGKSFRLNKISNVRNDESEYVRLNNSIHADRLYVACFTHLDEECKYMWDEYTKIDGKPSSEGVRIRLPMYFLKGNLVFRSKDGVHFDNYVKTDIGHKSYSNSSDWLIYTYDLVPIRYTSDLDAEVIFDQELYNKYKDCLLYSNRTNRFAKPNMELFFYPKDIGTVKSVRYQCERETRLLVAICPKGLSNNPKYTPKPPIDEIFLVLPDELINELTITLSPYTSTELQSKVERLFCNNGLVRIEKSNLSLNI